MVTFAALLTAVLYWLFLCHCIGQSWDRARRRAGPLLRKWPATHSRIRWFALLAASAMMIVYLTSHLCDMVDGGGWFMLVLAWFNATWMFWVFPFLLLPVVEFREGGMLEFGLITPLFLPWACVESCGTAASGHLQVQVGNKRYLLSKKCIPPGKIEEATAILCRYVEVRDARGVRKPAPSAADRPAEPARSAQGRFQFSLRSLLFFVLVASSALSLYGIRYRRDASDRELMGRLERFQPDTARIGSGFLLAFSASPVRPGDQEMEVVAKLSRVEWLELSGAPVTDAGLVHLEKLKSLRYVGLRGTRVTAAGVKKLQQALPGVEIAH